MLRRYVWRWVLEDEPDVPQREVDSLRFAARHELPVPHIIAFDIDGAAIGDGTPALLMTLVPGSPVASRTCAILRPPPPPSIPSTRHRSRTATSHGTAAH